MHKQDGDNKINKEQQKKLDKAIDKMLGFGVYNAICQKCAQTTFYRFPNNGVDVQQTQCPICGYTCQAWRVGEWE